MRCLYCQNDTRVVNSRLQKRSNNTWRRRHCIGCGAVFTSVEQINLEYSVRFQPALGKNIASQPFSRDKLFVSVYEACRHRKTALADATALTETILQRLAPHFRQAVVEREVVIATALTVLGRFDHVAATYYGAYHDMKQKTKDR